MYRSQRSNTARLGVEFRSDAAYVALVRPGDSAVVGLGMAMYPAGTVVDGVIRQAAPAAHALERLLSQIHWSKPPQAALVVPPATTSDPESTVSAPITDGGTIGEAVASARHVDVAVDAISRTGAEIELVDSVPVAVARLARMAEPELPMVFARGAAGHRSWTACADSLAVDIDLDDDRQTDAPDTAVIGADLRDMRPTRWGRIQPVAKVQRAFPEPGRFAPAVGAALATLGHGPAVDLAGPRAVRTGARSSERNWGVEVVR